MGTLARKLIGPVLLRPLPVLALLGAVILGAGGIGVASLLREQAAEAAFQLEWGQLIPPEEVAAGRERVVQGVVLHGQLDPKTGQPTDQVGLVRRYDGARVRIDGYLVPLAYDGTKLVMFLLVPYAGACIHVPPPPPNQIIYVIAKEGLEPDDDLFRPVRVTGTFKVVELSTAFAEVGYQIVADKVTYSG